MQGGRTRPPLLAELQPTSVQRASWRKQQPGPTHPPALSA